MKQLSNGAIRCIKTTVFLACPIPLWVLVSRGFRDGLGANPIEAVARSTGSWTLTLLLITLAVTPFRKLTGWQWLARLRRMIGLYAFFYACLHFLTYLVFDQSFDFEDMARDTVKRPYITIGLASFLLLIPLAATSTDAMIRRMGGRNWRRLHQLVFIIAAGGVFHYFWLVKRDLTGPAQYALVLSLLLCTRLVRRRRKRSLPKPTADAAMPHSDLIGPG